MLGMDELLVFGVEGTADWRRRIASKHPGDAARNVAAADMLTRLAQELRSLEGTSLHQQVDAVLTSDNDGVNAFNEIISQATRAVGFTRFPKSGREFLDALILELEHERGHVREENKPLPAQMLVSNVIRTPRFPSGITVGGLRAQSISVQKETMAFWFMDNYAPATGTYFGFTEVSHEAGALGGSNLGEFQLDGGAKIGGFDEGSWFTGGRASELLKAVFEVGVGETPIEQVAAIFDGLWESKSPKHRITNYATAGDVLAAISGAVDAFEARLLAITPKHGGMGHNGPPEDEPLTADEKARVFEATATMRLTVSTGDDPAVLDAIWSGLSGTIVRLGGWILKEVDMFLNDFTTAAGKALGEKSPHLLVAVGVWFDGAHITDLISTLLKMK